MNRLQTSVQTSSHLNRTSSTKCANHTNRMERKLQIIHPGGWAVGNQPLATLLGSCITVCLHDPDLAIGGMNHFMLPQRDTSAPDTDDLLRGDFAMEVLVNALMKRGAQKSRLQAKMFGGGKVVAALKQPIGERNAEFAQEWLQREDIPLLAIDVGGPWSRKVIYEPENGTAWCKRFAHNLSQSDEIMREEAAYAQRLTTPIKETGMKRVELF